jgi:hypothetical protein
MYNENNEKVTLTPEELDTYRLYGMVDNCNLCGNQTPIHKYDSYHGINHANYLTFNGKEFLCLRCDKE